jgi:hypothetical protein
MWYDMCPFFVANLLSKSYRLISVVAIWVHQTLFFWWGNVSNSFWYLFPFKSYFFMCTQLQVPFMKSNGFSLTMRTFTKKNHLANPKSTSPSSRNAFPPYRDARSPTPEAPMAKLTIVPWAVCSTENCWFFCETWRKCSDFLGNQYLPSGY